MRNKLTAVILLALFLLTGLGFVIKEVLKPQSKSDNEPTLARQPQTSIDDRLKAQRSLFQPLALTPAPQAKMRAAPVPVTVEKREIADGVDSTSLAKPPDTFSAEKLLQSNQHKQRATIFHKIAFDGQVLPNSTLKWSCARDINTGLLWETKLFDAGISDVEHRYSWYDPNRSTQGFQNRGRCYGIDCDTHAYTQEMNALGLCGSRQWRLPTFVELESLLDRNYFNPVINQDIFFNTGGASYWTQTQLDNNPGMIMQIDFFNGTSSPAPIHFKLAVRLVSE